MIISALNEFATSFVLSINLISNVMIFLGTCYVALQNRRLPKWHVTSLWYCGLLAVLTSITILVQWALGKSHPLSFASLGLLSQTLFNVALASVCVVMLIHTVKTDLSERENRKVINY